MSKKNFQCLLPDIIIRNIRQEGVWMAGPMLKKFDLILAVFFTGICASITSLILLFATGSFSAGTAACFLIAGGIFMATASFILAAVLYMKQVTAWTHAIKKAGPDSVIQDLVSLSQSIADFSRGNLTIQPESKQLAMAVETAGALSAISDLYKQILQHTRDAADNFRSITAVPCKRLCYVGADSYREGEQCGRTMAGILGDSGGEVAVFVNFKDVVSSNTRRKAFEKVLHELSPGSRVVSIIEEHENHEIAYQEAVKCLNVFPGLKGIYVADGTVPSSVAKAVMENGRERSIAIVCHDLTDETMSMVKKGVIKATLSQNPFVQGYNPVLYLYNFLVTKQPLPVNRLLTHIELITPENYREYWSDDKGMLITQATEATLEKPVPNKHNE
ncbi:MAG: sugar ABC transporter substrate-binding protein, partial [Spirochaetaceae bacterium]